MKRALLGGAEEYSAPAVCTVGAAQRVGKAGTDVEVSSVPRRIGIRVALLPSQNHPEQSTTTPTSPPRYKSSVLCTSI